MYKVKILARTLDSNGDYIIEEVKAEPCKQLTNCVWIQRDGTWFIYDVKTGRIFQQSDSRAYLEAHMNEYQRILEIERKSNIYQKRVQQFREMAGI